MQLHPELIYQLLFQAVWATLKAFGADPKRLGGQLGMTAVLHTWGQQLWRHVHLHCLIPGGALDAAGQWHAARSTYLFPDRALSRHFRGKLVSQLRQAYQQGKLKRITRPQEVDRLLDRLTVNRTPHILTKLTRPFKVCFMLTRDRVDDPSQKTTH